MLAAKMIPEVWVPPVHVRELRQLVSQRRRLVQMHTQIVNRMHSVSHRHHLGHPKGKRFQKKDMQWREQLPEMERFQLDLDLETKKYLKSQIERITAKLREMSHEEPWASQGLYLMQVPGFGVITAMTVLSAIGDISRFETPKHLVSYAGLAPGAESRSLKKDARNCVGAWWKWRGERHALIPFGECVSMNSKNGCMPTKPSLRLRAAC
jgi:transposase